MSSQPTFPTIDKHVEALYCAHHSWLKAWLNQRLGNAADAADLAHDTFLRVLRQTGLLSFPGPAHARSYLRKTAQNLCINLWHKQEVERVWLETLSTYAPTAYPSAERQAIVLDALTEVTHMLAALPVKGRQAFVLAQTSTLKAARRAAQLRGPSRLQRHSKNPHMLAALPVKVRQAFVLAQTSTLKEPQIAEQLGVSSRMVRNYMNQAMLACLRLRAQRTLPELQQAP